MAKILQSPIILPPESISKNTITRQAFSLGRAFAVTFQISSNNLKLIATESIDENGEIITEYTSEPDTDKELGFSIFLTDDTDAHTFGASAGRCGWIDYSTKGEVAEGINNNGDKVIIDFEDNSTKSDLDLLLDHVYPENINNLVKNQTPGLKSIFSMLFLSNKTFFNSVTDVYGNLYYDSLIVDADGNVTDFLTGELKPISEYQAPVIIQYSIGENIHYMVYDFIFEDKPIDILNINYYTFRLLFENHGGILTLEIRKPGETFYRPCMTKELPYNYYGNHNIRFGFGQFTPLFSYDIDKKANFNIHNIQLQQSDERPEWLKTLDKELKNLLGNIPFITELLGAENKLVIHTDRVEENKLQAIEELLDKVVPTNIKLVQHNHDISIPWQELPDGFTVVEWLESVDKQRINVQGVNLGTSEDSLTAKCLSPYSKNNYRFTFIRTSNLVDGGGFNLMVLIGPVHEGSVASWYGKCSIVCELEGNDADGNLIRPKDWVTDGNLADFVIIPDIPFDLKIEQRVMSINGVPRKKVDANYVFPVTKVDNLTLFNWWATTDLRVYNVQIVSVETGEMLLNMICCLDDTGAPCMLDRVSGTVFYNKSTGDFLYPGKEEEPATFSLRNPVTYAQLTKNGVRRLYHVPKGYNGTKEKYAVENGFKPLIETPMPEEGYWEPQWQETKEEIILEWVETEVPVQENINLD